VSVNALSGAATGGWGEMRLRPWRRRCLLAPFGLLGPHEIDGRWVVRVICPVRAALRRRQPVASAPALHSSCPNQYLIGCVGSNSCARPSGGGRRLPARPSGDGTPVCRARP
jgi:hypothetical protein